MPDLANTRAIAWPAKRLGEIFRINSDQLVPTASPKAEFVHYSIPAWDAIGGPAIELGSQIESNKIAISNPAVLVSKLNPRKPRVIAVHNPSERTCCSTEFICYQPKLPAQDLSFWAAYLSSSDFAARLARIAVGSTNSHTRAAPKETLKWYVPEVPPIQQQKLAQIFGTLQNAIHKTETIIAKLTATKQGLLHDLLTRGIDANGELRPLQAEAPHLYKQSRLGWIPKEWALSTIGNEFEIQLGKMLDSKKNAGVLKPYIGNKAVQWDRIDLSEVQYVRLSQSDLLRYRLDCGDLLICEGGEVGRAAIWEDEISECYYQKALHRLRPLRDYRPRLLLELLRYLMSKDALSEYISRTSIAHLTQEKLATVPLPAPDIEEQDRIVEKTMAMKMREESEIMQLQTLRSLKVGLMDDLLTGPVRVTPLLETATA